MDRDKQLILSLLSAVEEDAHTTQSTLATRLGVGVGLVNSYMKRVIYKGYIKTKRLERRRLLYLLTPSGIREKSRLTLEFLQYSYQFLRDVRSTIHDRLRPHASQGVRSVVLVGSGEMAELAYLAMTELGLSLQAIVDEDAEGTCCLNYTIRSLDWLEDNPRCDLLLVLHPPRGATNRNRLEAMARTHNIPVEEYTR